MAAIGSDASQTTSSPEHHQIVLEWPVGFCPILPTEPSKVGQDLLVEDLSGVSGGQAHPKRARLGKDQETAGHGRT